MTISAARHRSDYIERAMRAEAERDKAIKRAETAEAEVERLLAQNRRLRNGDNESREMSREELQKLPKLRWNKDK